MRFASTICVACAVVVCAWFALGIRQAHDTARAAAIVSQGNMATAAQERNVSSLVRNARLLNPDQEVNVLLGEIEVEHGDDVLAQRVLSAVTLSEPQNLQAWLWLAHASGSDPAGFYSALYHVRQLEPLVRAP